MGFLAEPTNWVLISFVIFAVLFVKFGLSSVLGKLDGRIDAIRNELAEAEKLRLEAQDLLASYQKKHRDAMQEAEEIVSRAKAQAEIMQAKAQEDLREVMARREKQLEDRLARIEAAAEAELRKQTAELAVKASEELIRKSLDAKAQSSLVEKSIAGLPNSLN